MSHLASEQIPHYRGRFASRLYGCRDAPRKLWSSDTKDELGISSREFTPECPAESLPNIRIFCISAKTGMHLAQPSQKSLRLGRVIAMHDNGLRRQESFYAKVLARSSMCSLTSVSLAVMERGDKFRLPMELYNMTERNDVCQKMGHLSRLRRRGRERN